jgi:hypothetical protein
MVKISLAVFGSRYVSRAVHKFVTCFGGGEWICHVVTKGPEDEGVTTKKIFLNRVTNFMDGSLETRFTKS